MFVDVVAAILTTTLLAIVVSQYVLIALPRPKYSSSYSPKVSIVVPAYNEERGIEDCVRAMCSVDYRDKEIIFVDDGSDDNTFQKLRQLSKKYPIMVFTKKHAGKAAALNFGISKAASDVIIVADADSSPSRDSIAELVKPLADRKIGAVAGVVRVRNKSRWITWFQSIEYAYFSYFNSICSKINGIIFTPGVMSAYSKSALEKVGLFPEGSAIEDFHIALKLHEAGYRITFADNAISHTHVPTTLRHLFRQRLRWSRGTIATIRSMRHLVFSKRNRAVGFYTMPMLSYWFLHSLLMLPIILYWVFSGYFKWFVANSAAFSADAGRYFFHWFSLFGMWNLFQEISLRNIQLNYLLAVSIIVTFMSYGFYAYSVYKYDRRIGYREVVAMLFFFPYILFIASVQIASIFYTMFSKKIKW